ADTDSVCFGNTLNLTKTVIGGEGICDIQWQINKTSSSQSSTNWKNISVSDALAFNFNNPGNDSTFYFRARVDCINSSCNIATSNVVSAVFHPQLSISVPFSDSTICAGANVNILSSSCKGEILWSSGETSAQINVSPTENTTYTVTCKNSCDAVSESVNIKVVPGIEGPINTTPDSVYSPSALIFTANGQSLKWYESAISSIPLSQTPEVTIPGLYTFWVSQTIGICESPRIQITARLIPELAIVTQPLSLINCYGNTSNFEISALGGDLIYQWQRKRPNETAFSNLDDANNYIDGALTEQLKIKSVGNAESPNGTLYRCIINNQIEEIISEEVSLNVNRVQGSLPNQKLCLGNDLNFNLNNTHTITGIPSVIQWQYRTGTGADWLDLADGGSISGTNSLQMSITELTKANEFQYRCSLLFNSSTGTCTETTDLMTLSVGDYPTKPNDIGFEFCQAEKSPKIELYEPSTIDVIWYPLGSTIGLTKQPTISTENAGDQLFYYSFKNQDECESEKALMQIIINPQPPKPTNTTPLSVFEEEGLEFTANGENLKWYTSRTGKTFINYSPTYQKIGSYDHYVSQTSQKGCESERLLIESEIIASFGIATQPSNQANCDKNTVTFTLKTKGAIASVISYQWQIKKDGVFIKLAGENTKDLKIADAGVAPHLDGSIYRCIVSNGTKEIISDEVSLSVNTILADLSNIKTCENESLSAKVFENLIQGTPKTFEWQLKEGSTYNTIFTTSSLDETFIPKPSESGDYRLRVTFFNQGSSTCVRNSNTLKININKNPEPLKLSNLDLCQFSTFDKVFLALPANTILVNLDSSKIENFTFSDATLLSYLAYIKDANSCESPYSKIDLNILEAPEISILENTFVFCQFSEKTKPLKINNLNTFWFINPEDEDYTENFVELNADIAQKQYAAVEGKNGCFSFKTAINFSLEPCFYDTKADSCISQTGLTLDPNQWNYIYDKNGKIFAAIHPKGQNLGKVSFDLKTTQSKSIKDLNLTDFYPRYFRFTASKVFSSNVKLRFYLTNTEIENFDKKISEEVLIVNYAGLNPDCDLGNNDLTDNYWLETSTTWQNAAKEGFKFVEFSSQKTGEFGLWSANLPLGILEGDLNTNKLPQLNIIDFESKGIYSIQKSKDEENWFEWIPKIENPLFADQKPFITENFYALIYDFGNGIKTRRNQVKISVPEDNLTCLIFENPSENRELLKLYFPNVDKTSVRLSNVAGQKVDILSILEKEDYLEIHPQTHIPAGLYTLSSLNQNGEQCSVKVWMR
ncbi:hypothetical protein EGI22_15000, partial [Lacihabitans sp. LS3-19]|uniref:hypothetical protein n=1 Tax=Lacihabitans sp. LS3-19 TaxID=2487335 RepID=UPI0020CC449C